MSLPAYLFLAEMECKLLAIVYCLPEGLQGYKQELKSQ